MYEPPRKRKFNGKKKTVCMRLPSNLLRYYQDLAKATGLGISDVIADMLDQGATHRIEVEKAKKKRGA